MEKITTFRHSGNAGDIIYALEFMRRATPVTHKAVVYLYMDQPSGFTTKEHPLGPVMLNDGMYDLLRPLLLSQDWIEAVERYEHQTHENTIMFSSPINAANAIIENEKKAHKQAKEFEC